MKIIALYSIKGGVGKTATSVNLAWLASQNQKRTLLCDLDPQGASSYYFRIRPRKKLSPENIVRGGGKLDKHIRGTDFEGLDLLPAHLSFRNLDLALDAAKRSKKRLSETLDYFSTDYDYIFLDCPPNLTLVSENVFRAADLIVVPVIPTSLSINTFKQLTGFFKDQDMNRAKISGLFSMVEKRKKLHTETIEALSKTKNHFFDVRIPYLSDIEKMGVTREPVVSTAPKSVSSKAYLALWNELRTCLS